VTDIVERLRGIVVERKVRGRGATITINQNITGWLEEAADEIERLRNTIKNCPPVSESEYVRRLESEIAK